MMPANAYRASLACMDIKCLDTSVDAFDQLGEIPVSHGFIESIGDENLEALPHPYFDLDKARSIRWATSASKERPAARAASG